MTEKLYLCSANPRLINKNERNDMEAFSEGFIQSSLSQRDLATLVSRGVAFSYVFKDDRREKKNFLGTEVVAVDIDGLLTIEEVCSNPLVTDYAGFVYTTFSHTPESPRLRVVFFLEEGLVNPDELRALSTALALRLSGDMAATDPARIFYGSSNCEVFNFAKELSKAAQQDFLVQGEEALKARSHGNTNGSNSWSSARPLPDDLIVRTRRGESISVTAITKNTSIFCPDHFDTNPSAFVGVTPRGAKFIYCHVCRTTRWLSTTKRAASFYHFEDTVRELAKRSSTQTSDIETPFGLVSETTLVGGNISITNQRHFSIQKLRGGITFVKSPKGSGKTTMMLEVLKPFTEVIRGGDLSLLFLEENEDLEAAPLYEKSQTKFSILLIGHRQALIRELCKRLNLNCYLDDEHSNSRSSYGITGQSRRHQQERQKRYGVCLDSLSIVQLDAYDLVILDESEQVLGHFLSETMASRRQSVFRRFTTIVRESKRVVCLDADLSWVSFMTLTDLACARSRDWSLQDQSTSTKQSSTPSKQVHVFINRFDSMGRKIELYESKQHLIGDMESDIETGKKIFFTSNSKNQVDRLFSILVQRFPDKKILKVTSENSNSDDIQSILLNAKEVLPQFDLVLTSPSLSTGIDLTFDNEQVVFQAVYGVFQPMVNTHFEIDQQLSRVRQTHTIRCWISPERFAFEDDLSVVSIDLFSQNLEANTFSGFQPVDWEEIDLNSDPFLRMGSLILSQQRASMNSLRANYIEYKEQQGYEISSVSKDLASSGRGKAIDDQGRVAAFQQRVDAIMNSEPIDQTLFLQVSESIRSSRPVDERLLRAYERHQIEFFNRRDLCEEDVSAFLDGRHEKVRLLEKLLILHSTDEDSDPTIPSLVKLRRDRVLGWLETKDLKLKIDQPIDLKAYVWGEIFVATPLFKNGAFVDVEITKDDLVGLSDVIRKYEWVFDTFLVRVRADLSDKAMRFLGDRLRDVGLELVNCRVQQSGGKKTYFYSLGDQAWFKSLASSIGTHIGSRSGKRTIIQLVEDRRRLPSSSYITQYWRRVHEINRFDSLIYERILEGDGRYQKWAWIPMQSDLEGRFRGHQ